MKAVILAGGKGSRLSEFTDVLPKPLVPIDNFPILIHIMDIYGRQGVKDFIILTGHKGHLIREFFFNFWPRFNDFTINLNTNKIQTSSKHQTLNWNVSLIDTGENTMTGGRLLRAKKLLEKEESFYFTYGDGLSNVNLKNLYKHHLDMGAVATVTAVQPPGRFGALKMDKGMVKAFLEKPEGDGAYINGGFFVFTNEIFNFLENDETVLEKEPLTRLAAEGKFSAFVHTGFWQCMDTLRDVEAIKSFAKMDPCPWLENEK